MALLEEDREALEVIRNVLQENSTPHWQMPPEFAFRFAYEIANLPPAAALQKAQSMIDNVHQHNATEVQKGDEASLVLEKLRENPITNAGSRSFGGFLLRQFLAFLNGTPFSRLDWLEVDDTGLHIYEPFSNVSQRTVKQRDIVAGTVVLSVNPASYLDWPIGFLRQFRRNVPVLIGEIVVYEPGSGRTVGSAVAWRPDRKLVKIKAALVTLGRVENPYAGFQRVPRLEDFFVYYDVHRWEQESVSVDMLNPQG